jgi:hypothetical protein
LGVRANDSSRRLFRRYGIPRICLQADSMSLQRDFVAPYFEREYVAFDRKLTDRCPLSAPACLFVESSCTMISNCTCKPSAPMPHLPNTGKGVMSKTSSKSRSTRGRTNIKLIKLIAFNQRKSSRRAFRARRSQVVKCISEPFTEALKASVHYWDTDIR